MDLDSDPPLNATMLSGNTCFGCSLKNTEGMQIRIFRDPNKSDGLVGHYKPRETHGGFPFITHGGLQFTALDCMAGWIVFGAETMETPVLPLTQSARVEYKRPANIHQDLFLSSELVERKAVPGASAAQELLHIRAELKNSEGKLLTRVDFDYVCVPAESFCKVVGIAELPETFRTHLGL